MNNESLTKYVAAFVDELTKASVSNVVISPGSRSTPLALMMQEHPQMKTWINIDERSAGFFALGIAKSTKEPVALLCTSGTAAANYLPAVVEAYESRVPLIVLTADRPHELRDIGAPQAINQMNMYANYVKWFVEMAVPEDNEQLFKYVRTTAVRAAATAKNGPSGPVQLNFPFREPLIPNLELPNLWDFGSYDRNKYVNVIQGKLTLDDIQLEELISYFDKVDQGLIVCGPNDDMSAVPLIIELAEKLGYPILADPLSQLRCNEFSKSLVIDSYDAFLRNEKLWNSTKPDVIIRFGAMPVSKAFLLFLKANASTRQIVIDPDGGWRDPLLQTNEMIFVDSSIFCKELIEKTEKKSSLNWINKWMNLHILSREITNEFQPEVMLFEGHVITHLQQILPENAGVFIGNSMPVRDLDTFLTTSDQPLRVFANRGANGIDGLISSALGISTNHSPLVLVLGDLSFYHDLNGLLASKLHKLDITIVVINNDGGGIFSFLPQAKHEKHFEDLFGTPIGLDYEHVVNMYDGNFKRIKEWNEFEAAIRNSINSGGLHVIEVPTDRVQNVNTHRKLWGKISKQIDEREL